ncbi:198_t:CDS:2 [Funneliformis geosporum]|nr:198_t:CDS:2 [Funneliformis geosporum]
MSNGANAQKFENAMRDILRTAQHVLAIDAFVNASTLTFLKAYYGENIRVIDNKFQPLIDKTVEYLYDPNSGAKAMRIGYKLLQQGKHVAFVLTSCSMARALVEKASKLPKSDNSHIRASYTSIVEADISFKKTNYFEAVIGITNITTPVNVEAFIQMIFQIRDCKKCILSFYYQKNSSDLFRPPGYENICAELESARLNNLPTAIRRHREWDKNIVSYKLDQSPAVISYLEVEHRKRFSARNFIEISCSLIASTGASLQLIKMDESQGVIGNCKRIHTMALKRFYMQNLYGKDMDIEDWNNLCNKKFVERFSPPEPRKYFLRLSHFRKQAEENLEKSIAEDLRKTYSANH